MASRSRRMLLREVFICFPPSASRGRRECRAPDAPDSRVCNGSKQTHTRCQVTPESPGIPHAMVYGLYRALPGARALWSPSSRGYLRETWRQRRGVRTTRLRRPRPALSSEAPSASTASRPALVTIAKRPSSGTGRRISTTDLGGPASVISVFRHLFSYYQNIVRQGRGLAKFH